MLFTATPFTFSLFPIETLLGFHCVGVSWPTCCGFDFFLFFFYTFDTKFSCFLSSQHKVNTFPSLALSDSEARGKHSSVNTHCFCVSFEVWRNKIKNIQIQTGLMPHRDVQPTHRHEETDRKVSYAVPTLPPCAQTSLNKCHNIETVVLHIAEYIVNASFVHKL